MQDATLTRATYDDVLAAPPHMVAELFGGVLSTMPRPAPRHANVTSSLGAYIAGPFQHHLGGPGGWWIIDEPELHLGEDVAVPDLAGWRRERMARLPDAAWFGLPPDWACEVLSPSTRRIDEGIKRELYAQHGVGHLWLIDPAARLLEAFELTHGRWLLLRTWRDDDEVAAAPFAAAPFRLDVLWADDGGGEP